MIKQQNLQGMIKQQNLQGISVAISYHIIIRFLFNMQVQGQHPHQWAPFQIAGSLHAWQISHQISRYVYHEGLLPRASTLCNPSLSASSMSSWASLSLYVKGCLDCTTGAFHMSIPAEPSLLQNEVQILSAKPCK